MAEGDYTRLLREICSRLSTLEERSIAALRELGRLEQRQLLQQAEADGDTLSAIRDEIAEVSRRLSRGERLGAVRSAGVGALSAGTIAAALEALRGVL